MEFSNQFEVPGTLEDLESCGIPLNLKPSKLPKSALQSAGYLRFPDIQGPDSQGFTAVCFLLSTPASCLFETSLLQNKKYLIYLIVLQLKMLNGFVQFLLFFSGKVVVDEYSSTELQKKARTTVDVLSLKEVLSPLSRLSQQDCLTLVSGWWS